MDRVHVVIRPLAARWSLAAGALFCALALLLALAAGDAAAQAPGIAPGTIPGQYIVVLKGNAGNALTTAAQLSRSAGVRVGHVYGNALNGFSATVSAGRLAALARDPRVAYIEPDLVATASAQTAPTGILRINAVANSIAAIDGVDERVDADIAILDTGISLSHPDLNVYRQVTFAGGANANDRNGHGTHVAGTAAALDNGIGVVGVAPGARLWAVKVLGNSGSGSFSNVIAGLNYVTANADQIEVVNMSLGGVGRLNSLRTAIQNCVNAGVVVVVAAGNSSQDVYGGDHTFNTGDDAIPAAYPEAAAISALADSDGASGGAGGGTSYGADDTLASFSNFSTNVASGNPVNSPGAAIDFAAPGVGILSTLPGGYGTGSGTSMASPHGAGAAALFIAANGRAIDSAGVAAIRQGLIDGGEAQSQWRGGLTTNDPDGNAEHALDVADGPAPPVDDPPSVSITSPSDGDTFASGASINFAGSADDTEDGDISGSIAWTSDIDGAIGNGNGFSRTISDGEHTITAEVTDSAGNIASDSISIMVGDPPPPAELSVTVSTDQATYSNRDTVLIIVQVTNGSGSPAGALVHVDLRTPSGRTFAGDAIAPGSGEVIFTHKVNTKRDGSGPYSVDAIASLNGSQASDATEFTAN